MGDDLVTGSIATADEPAIVAPALQSFVSQTSWPTLEAALVSAIVDGEDGVRVPWKNAATGEHGTVTPLTPQPDRADAGDTACRTIAVTAAKASAADEMLGEACALAPRRWVFEPLAAPDAGDDPAAVDPLPDATSTNAPASAG